MFAAIALVVGTFLIINTFSILVAQRSRELALLRAMGASRRQVNRSVLAEAFAVGLIGSTVGIGVGYLLALGLKALFGVIGLDIGSATFPLKLRTIIICVRRRARRHDDRGVPARRGAQSRSPPVAAMRDDVALPESSLHSASSSASVLVVVGAALDGVGLFASVGNGAAASRASGRSAILVGVSLTAPVIGRPVIRGRRRRLPAALRDGRRAGDARTRCATRGGPPRLRAR